MPFSERARRLLEFHRPHLIGRRVDQIAREKHTFRNARDQVSILAIGHNQPRLFLGSFPGTLPVAVETVCSNRPGIEGTRTAKSLRHTHQSVNSGWQPFRKQRQRMRIASDSQPQYRACQRARVTWQQRELALLARKPDGAQPRRFVRAETLQQYIYLTLQHRMKRKGFFCAELGRTYKQVSHSTPCHSRRAGRKRREGRPGALCAPC